MNQAYSRLSTTHGHITDCKFDSVVYAGVRVVILMWTCRVWAERSTPDNLWVPNHRFNSTTGEQKLLYIATETTWTILCALCDLFVLGGKFGFPNV